MTLIVVFAGVACGIGYYCLGGSHDVAACPLGTFASSPGSTTSACGGKCEAGYYGATTAQTTSTCSGPCPLGTYASLTGSTSPACGGLCAAGYFGNTTGQSSIDCTGPCTAEPGYYCPAGSNSTTGIVCPSGSFCFGGSADRAPCGTGLYGATEGLSSEACTGLCYQGYYGSVVGLVAPTCSGECSSPPGSYCPAGSNSSQGEMCCVATHCLRVVSCCVVFALESWVCFRASLLVPCCNCVEHAPWHCVVSVLACTLTQRNCLQQACPARRATSASAPATITRPAPLGRFLHPLGALRRRAAGCALRATIRSHPHRQPATAAGHAPRPPVRTALPAERKSRVRSVHRAARVRAGQTTR